MEKIKQILRSRSLWTTIGALAIMALVALIYFYPDDVEGNLLNQHDIRQGYANGQEAQAFTAASGETTRWTNALFGGMPTFQISPSYDSDSLFMWLNKLYGFGLPEPANLLMMMMLGFFILLMVMRQRWYVSLIGAIAYGFSSYFIIIIGAGHIWKFVTLAYVPPTIAGLVLCYRGRYLWGGALTALFATLQIAWNHVQMTYYFLPVVLGFVIVYLIGAVRKKEMRRWVVATAVALFAGVLAVTANLPSLYNTYEYSKQTIRGNYSDLPSTDADATDTGLSKEYLTMYSYGQSESFTLLIPNIKGGATNKPEKGAQKYLSLNKTQADKLNDLVADGTISRAETAYLQLFTDYFGEPEGTNGPVYVGALVMVFFLLGCIIVRGPLKWVLIVLTILSILLAMGRNCMWLTDFMISYMPLYSKFRTPESILVIAEFTIPLLGALALGRIFSVKPAEAWKRWRLPIYWSFGICAAICLIALLFPSLFGPGVTPHDQQIWNQYVGAEMPYSIYTAATELRYGLLKADALRSLFIILLGGAVTLCYLRGRMSVKVAAIGIGVIIAGDLLLVGKRYVDHDSFSADRSLITTRFRPTAADSQILADGRRWDLPDGSSNYRVLDFDRFSSAEPSYFHKTVGGYHAAKLTRVNDIITYYFDGNHDLLNVADMLNTRYYVQRGQVMPNPDALGNAWLVDTLTYVNTPTEEITAIEHIHPATTAVADHSMEALLGKSAPTAPGDTIYATSYAPNRLSYRYHTAGDRVAVFSEIYFPWGWQATVDGKPVEIGRVDYILRAIRLPGGDHELVMTFDPPSIHTTVTAATIAVIIIYLALLAAIAAAAVRYFRGRENKE